MKTKTNNFLNHTFISNLIDNNSVILDLGANYGEFSKFIKKRYGSRIYAIEAVPDLCKKINKIIGIKTFNYCICNSNETCKISVPKEGCASNKLDKIDGELVEVQGITLKKFLLDQEIKRVDLLKIDIEGAEIEVLNNVSDDILNKINQITIEFHDFLWPETKKEVEKIKTKIKKIGFYCISFSLTNNGDVLFIKKNSISFFSYLYLKYLLRYLIGIKRKFFENE
jgi:FkbM family methyltransferase